MEKFSNAARFGLTYTVINNQRKMYVQDTNPLDIATPQIDAAFELFRLRGATTPEISTTATDVDMSPHDPSYCQEDRKMQTPPRKKSGTAKSQEVRKEITPRK